MCPACMASAALMVGSVSTGGIAALAVNMVRGKKLVQNDNLQQVTERRNGNGNDEPNNEPNNEPDETQAS